MKFILFISLDEWGWRWGGISHCSQLLDYSQSISPPPSLQHIEISVIFDPQDKPLFPKWLASDLSKLDDALDRAYMSRWSHLSKLRLQTKVLDNNDNSMNLSRTIDTMMPKLWGAGILEISPMAFPTWLKYNYLNA
jgi:hypothetical protein